VEDQDGERECALDDRHDVSAVLGGLIGVREGRLWVSSVAILRCPVQNP